MRQHSTRSARCIGDPVPDAIPTSFWPVEDIGIIKIKIIAVYPEVTSFFAPAWALVHQGVVATLVGCSFHKYRAHDILYSLWFLAKQLGVVDGYDT